MVASLGQRPEIFDNVFPIEGLDIWRGGIVLPQALQLGQGKGEKLVLGVETLEIQKVLLLMVWRNNQVSGWDMGLHNGWDVNVGHNSRTLGVQMPKGLSLHLGHKNRPLRNCHDG